MKYGEESTKKWNDCIYQYIVCMTECKKKGMKEGHERQRKERKMKKGINEIEKERE